MRYNDIGLPDILLSHQQGFVQEVHSHLYRLDNILTVFHLQDGDSPAEIDLNINQSRCTAWVGRLLICVLWVTTDRKNSLVTIATLALVCHSSRSFNMDLICIASSTVKLVHFWR
jgi:hypothetical protein